MSWNVQTPEVLFGFYVSIFTRCSVGTFEASSSLVNIKTSCQSALQTVKLIRALFAEKFDVIDFHPTRVAFLSKLKAFCVFHFIQFDPLPRRASKGGDSIDFYQAGFCSCKDWCKLSADVCRKGRICNDDRASALRMQETSITWDLALLCIIRSIIQMCLDEGAVDNVNTPVTRFQINMPSQSQTFVIFENAVFKANVSV